MPTPVTADPWTSEQYTQKFIKEYVRQVQFYNQIGMNEEHIIQFSNKVKSKTVVFPLIGKPDGDGVSGKGVLTGNEGDFSRNSHLVTPVVQRYGFEVDEEDEHISEVELFGQFRPQLKTWCRIRLRNSVIDGFFSVADGKTMTAPLVPLQNAGAANESGVNIAATEAEKDAWLAANENQDRVQFGDTAANLVSGDFSGSALVVDGNDNLTAAVAEGIKDRMMSASVGIRPTGLDNEGREYFVAYCQTKAFRQIANDSKVISSIQNNHPRDKKSPIIQSGDIVHDGIVYKNVPEFPVLAGAGAGGIDLSPVVFCGAQSLAYGQSKKTKFVKGDQTDYENLRKRGVREFYKINKMQRNGVDNGTFTAFFGAA